MGDGEMKISGCCFCGEIEYVAEIDENRVGICHCRDCQIFSGSAFRTVGVARRDKFSFTKGAPRYFDKTADTGRIRRMAFGSTCGTHLASLPEDMTQEGALVSVRVANSDAFGQLTPTGEVFCDSRVPLLKPIDGARQYPRMLDA